MPTDPSELTISGPSIAFMEDLIAFFLCALVGVILCNLSVSTFRVHCGLLVAGMGIA